VAGSGRSEVPPSGAIVTDMSSGEQIGDVDNLGAFGVALGAYQGMALEVTHIGAASLGKERNPRIGDNAQRGPDRGVGSPRFGCGVLAWERADPADQFWNYLPKIGDCARVGSLGNGE
jgi:hypothetical protein